jgi:aminoglycoside phosphotransferase
MIFFYLDKKIENPDLKRLLGKEKFSEIFIQKSSLSKIIQQSLDSNFSFKKIDSTYEIESTDDDIIVWNSNIICKDEISQRFILKKLINSYFSLFYGSLQSYIFKGRSDELKKILNANNKYILSSSIVQLESEQNIVTINTIWDLKNFSLLNPHVRYFNKLKFKDKLIIKKSTRKIKIIEEFNFLNNLPKKIKKYYVTVSNLLVKENFAQYSMNKINGIDLSLRYINKSFSAEIIKNIFDEIKIYFDLTLTLKGLAKESACDFLVKKNNYRLLELERWGGFGQLNTFVENHTSFSSIKNLFDLSNKLLSSNKTLLNSTQTVFSHGDLCFSNIILDDERAQLVFIDPKGVGVRKIDDCYRSPYYDLAKLSHSLLGGYDHIINDIAEINFDNNMKASLQFNHNLDEYKNIFKTFVNSLGFDYYLVRQIEISLFLSMLPLHIETPKKVNMLVLRACELINGLKK